MKTPTKKTGHKLQKIILLSLIVFALVTGGVIFAIQQNNKTISTEQKNDKVNDVDLETPSQEETDDGNATKDNTVSPEKTPSNNDGSASQETTAMTITSKNQNGDALQIRTQIGTLSSSGNCTLTLSDGKQTLTRTAPVQALASVTTCAGFDIDIPSSGLQKGTWTIKLDYSSQALKATVSDTVSIK